MKNGRFLITIILICVITAGLGCGFYVVRKHNLVTNQVQQTGNQKNNQAVTIKKHFYHKSIREVPGETVLADYPKSFNELIKKGQLTVLGTVTDLKNVANDSLPNRPVTMATVKVLQVLSGRQNKKDTTIKVLFMGGNIA
ncbi:hypothetical protein EQ500_09910, partial [Lactobacillus sp. XV13L]|nr:hypothetical protein [Lactobacillus sp. XV13L]